MRNGVFILCSFFVLFSVSLETFQFRSKFTQLLRVAPLVGGASIMAKEIYDNHMYSNAIQKKLATFTDDINSFEPFVHQALEEKYEKAKQELQHTLKGKNLKLASPWLTFLTQAFFLIKGIPVRLGRTSLYVDTHATSDVAVSFVQENINIIIEHAEGTKNKDFAFAFHTYWLTIAEYVYDGVKNAFNPFYCFKHSTVTVSLYTADYVLELEIPTDLMRAIYLSGMMHEGGHVMQIIYGQEVQNYDISHLQGELFADAQVKGAYYAQGFLAASNISKLYTICKLLPDVRNETGEKASAPYVLDNYAEILEMSRKYYDKEYKKENYHPTQDERIAYFTPLVTSRDTREIKVKIFNRKNELQTTLALREADDFKIPW